LKCAGEGVSEISKGERERENFILLFVVTIPSKRKREEGSQCSDTLLCAPDCPAGTGSPALCLGWVYGEGSTDCLLQEFPSHLYTVGRAFSKKVWPEQGI